MNVFELLLWAIEAFGNLGNFITTALFTKVPPIISVVPGVGLVSLTEATLATIIVAPATLAILWAWQVFKAITV